MPLLGVEGEDRTVLDKYFIPVQFNRNACILHEGENGDGCYMIDEGTVRLEVKNIETDTDGVIGFLEAGDFLGEFSLLDGRPRSASAYAHTDVKARWFSAESYHSICQQHPKIGLSIATDLGQNLTAKLREFNQKIAGYIFAGDIDRDTHETVAKAQEAQRAFSSWAERQVDSLLADIAEAVADKAEELAAKCVAETGIGIIADKVMKIRFASLEILKIVSGQQAAGLLKTDPLKRVSEIAVPVGVVFGIIPVTNPVSTIIFKTLISIKGRNALILSCHRDALGVGTQTCDIIRKVLVQHGAPKDLVQSVVKRTSRQKTMMFMNHPGVSLILATGGASLVKAAYSSGTPAIGVGAGNAPVLICSDVDHEVAAIAVIRGKSFDNGVICGSENNLVVVTSIYDKFRKALEKHGAVIITEEEKERLTNAVFEPGGDSLKRAVVGKSASFIADLARIRRDKDFRLIVVPITGDEINGPYAHEKLCPVLSLYAVVNETEGISVCKQILNNQGRGHTAVLHTHNEEIIKLFGKEIEASRILVNASAAQGCVGLGTGLTPSFTLGCGTFGGNSTTDNITYTHLLNIKRLAIAL